MKLSDFDRMKRILPMEIRVSISPPRIYEVDRENMQYREVKFGPTIFRSLFGPWQPIETEENSN